MLVAGLAGFPGVTVSGGPEQVPPELKEELHPAGSGSGCSAAWGRLSSPPVALGTRFQVPVLGQGQSDTWDCLWPSHRAGDTSYRQIFQFCAVLGLE